MKSWMGIPICESKVLPKGTIKLVSLGEYTITIIGVGDDMASNDETHVLDVNLSVPVRVAQDALAKRALIIFERELTRAAKQAIVDFIANGVTAELEKLAVKAEQERIIVHGK